MDRLKLDPNDLANERIQDWLIQSWFAKEPESLFREALIYIVLSLWPKHHETIKTGSKPSYFPLPTLCCQFLGKESARIVEVNAAWILLYMASYLLDKVEDQEYNHPLVAQFGPSVVANLTTGLLFHAGQILAVLEPDQDVSRSTIDAIRCAFYPTALEVCSGQHVDLTIREPSITDAWNIIDFKSGKFFSLGCSLGARLATQDAARLEHMAQFGRRLGILVQLANDLEGIGKEDGSESDLSVGKRTLPVIYTLQVLQEQERSRLLDVLAACPNDRAAIIEARKMVINSGAIVYLSLEAEKHRQMAKKIINQIAADAGSGAGDGIMSESETAGSLVRLVDYAFDTRIVYRQLGETHG